MFDKNSDNSSSFIDSRDDICGIPPPNDISSHRSAYHHFEYDIFLVYDEDYDHKNAEEVMKMVSEEHCKEGRSLKILDFAKDLTPGTPANNFFENALKISKYTCIIISRYFFDNLWMQFKADMAIQNMLLHKHKQYTLVVVVMDFSLKIYDLPLDLQTLSPILCSERYYEHKIRKAFQNSLFEQRKNCPRSTFDRITYNMPIQESSQNNQAHENFSNFSSCSSGFYHWKTNSKTTKQQSTQVKSQNQACINSNDYSNVINSITDNRTPQEHTDFQSIQYSKTMKNEYERQASIITKSTGLRQPTECDDTSKFYNCSTSMVSSSFMESLPVASCFSQSCDLNKSRLLKSAALGGGESLFDPYKKIPHSIDSALTINEEIEKNSFYKDKIPLPTHSVDTIVEEIELSSASKDEVIGNRMDDSDGSVSNISLEISEETSSSSNRSIADSVRTLIKRISGKK